MFIAAGMGLANASTAQADNGRSVNFLVFIKAQPHFEYDPIMFGDFSHFIQEMKGANLLLLSHSAKSIDGDVINLQQDVLKEVSNDKFTDVGVNCQINFHTVPDGSDIEYQLGGNCQILENFKGNFITIKAQIPKTDLPDSAKGTDVWMEVYEDARSGIAFYANVSLH